MHDVQQHDTSTLFGLSIADFAKRLGISRSTTWALIRADKLRTVRVGTRRLIPSSELSRILAEAR